ncbi:MAG TPA: DUF2306 domain-containing protein [Pyrinomonadaceae bacterium]
MVRVLKIIGWVVMLVLALGIALVSFRFFVLKPEMAAGPPFAQRFAAYITPLLFHAGGGIVALVLGPWGFWGGLRNKHLRLHRWMGRVYLVAVLTGGSAGLIMAVTAFGGLPTRIGFTLLDLLWLTTGVTAYLHIRRGRVQAHREWMIRNYALTFSAVMLRVWLPLFLMLGYGFSEAYTTVAWLAWVPNLLIAELVISKRRESANRRDLKLNAVTVRAA